MRLLTTIHRLSILSLCIADLAHDLHNAGIASLRHLPNKYESIDPIYTADNIEHGVWIPEYDPETRDYKGTINIEPLPEVSEGISLLEKAAEAGSSEAASDLGDIYTFGNFSVKVNYTTALAFYHRSVSLKANGHAYFMLGFMYSTGMFGEIPMNKQRAAVYYEFAAKNDDFNAQLVLANNYYHGISCAADCSVSKFYYSTVARKTMNQLADLDPDSIEEHLSYNLALPDFKGGLYGQRVSESASTVSNRVSSFLALRESVRDSNFNSQDSNIVDYYFDAYENYHGSYFKEKNYTKAFHNSVMCISNAREKFGGTYFELSTQIDRYVWSRCQSLLGKLYFNGHGVQRNVTKAYLWLKSGQKIYSDKETLLTLALFHQLDPSIKGGYTELALNFLKDAATNGSGQAGYLLSKAGIAPRTPLQTSFSKGNYDLMKFAAKSDILPALFYFADAAESGYSSSVGDKYECEHIVGFYKSFVERSEKLVLPHLRFALEELKFGNYKNALLGFLMAAEQGLAYSQVSASYLLYQMEPLFSFSKKKFVPERIRSALTYLELASAQDHLDSTILLGDLYSAGFEAANVSVDNTKAFAYYSKAALVSSGHGCYKLGYMYEYGLGSPNNTVDYYMAKRYYDMARKYYKERDVSHHSSESKASTFPVTLALLRLRFKMLFTGQSNEKEMDSSGWLSTFKKLAKSEESQEKESNAQAKSEAHLEGGTYEGDDDYETFDYIVLTLTIAFFFYMALENVRGHFRRVGRRRNGDGAENQNANNEQAPRFRVEFFFAI